MWIYKNYFLPSQIFLLTVHDITSTDLKKLENLTNKYLKKWAGLPVCTTTTLLHLRTGLDIKSKSDLYEESHCVTQEPDFWVIICLIMHSHVKWTERQTRLERNLLQWQLKEILNNQWGSIQLVVTDPYLELCGRGKIRIQPHYKGASKDNMHHKKGG